MNGKMKALVFYEKEDMRLEERDIPEVGPDQVLVKVAYVGICSSDVSYFFGMSPLGTDDGKGPAEYLVTLDLSADDVDQARDAGDQQYYRQPGAGG